MNDMKRRCAIAAILMTLCTGASIAPVRAAPPTVTPSPGYDARLQEQRAASTVSQPPTPAPVSRHRAKRHRYGAH
jgi:hypothetical protein